MVTLPELLNMARKDANKWYSMSDTCPHILTALQFTDIFLVTLYRVSPPNCWGNCEYCYKKTI